MTTSDTVAFLGGPEIFGRAIESELDLAAEVSRGFPSAALECVVARLHCDAIPRASIYAVVGATRTLQRKRQDSSMLSREQSDRLARLARVAVRAAEALGSTDAARRWLGKSNRGVNGERPLDLLSSDPGTRLVEDVLGRLEHGVVS